MIIVVLLVAVGGGVGAIARYLLDTLVGLRISRSFPAGTMIINVTGSFLLGMITGFAATLLPVVVATAVGAGVLGGYTTLSTASVETVRLLQERRWAAVAVSAGGTLVLATAAAWAGLLLGRAV